MTAHRDVLAAMKPGVSWLVRPGGGWEGVSAGAEEGGRGRERGSRGRGRSGGGGG